MTNPKADKGEVVDTLARHAVKGPPKPDMPPKIARLRRLYDERCPVIEVDGGQDAAHAREAVQATAIVAGSVIFGAPDHTQAIAAIRRGCDP